MSVYAALYECVHTHTHTHIYIYIYIYIYKLQGGACGVIVIVVENRLFNPS